MRAKQVWDGQVECDDCQAQFRIEPQVERTADGGERRWFACPGCGREYFTATITPQGVKLRSEIQALVGRMRQARNSKGRVPNRLSREVRRLQALLAGEVSRG